MAFLTNLAAYWKMNESGGNAIDSYDVSHLTETSGTIDAVAGILTGARDFEEADTEYFARDDCPELSTGNISFTFQAWVKLESKPAALMNILGKENNTAPGTEYGLRWNNTNDRFEFYVGGPSTWAVVTASNFGAPVVGTWYHIICWHDAALDTVNIKVNNGTANSASTGGAAPPDTTGPFTVGCTWISNAPARYWDGPICEVGFWKRVLTGTEHSQLYNGGAGFAYPFGETPPTPGARVSQEGLVVAGQADAKGRVSQEGLLAAGQAVRSARVSYEGLLVVAPMQPAGGKGLRYATGVVQWLTTDAVNATYAVTGVGFQPRALRFTHTGTTAVGVTIQSAQDGRRGVGFAASPTDRRAIGGFDNDATASGGCAACYLADAVAVSFNKAGTAGKLDLASLNSDGFTLVVDEVLAMGNLAVVWEAWGGDDLVDVVTGVGNEATATGLQTTTVGFQPDALVLAGAATGRTSGLPETGASGFCLGFVGGGGQVVAAGSAADGVATMQTGAYAKSDECLAYLSPAGAAVTARATWNDFTATGFRLNWLEVTAAQRWFIYLAFRGGQWAAGEATSSTLTLGNMVMLGGSLPFRPVGVSLVSAGRAESATDTASAQDRMTFGAAQSTSNRRSQGYISRDGVADAEVYVGSHNANVLYNITPAGAVLSAHDVQSFDPAGVILVVTATGSLTNEWMGWFTFGPNPFSGTASLVVKGATCAATATLTVPPPTRTGTAALTAKGATFFSLATFVAPEFAASATLLAKGATCTASATFVKPTYTGTATLGVGAATCAATATSAAMVTGTAALAAKGATCSSSATFVPPPTRTATAAVTAKGATCSASATFVPPGRVATAALLAKGATFHAQAQFAPRREATAVLTSPAARLAAQAQSIPPGAVQAEASLLAPPANFSATATFAPGVKVAAGHLTCPRIQFSATAQSIAPVAAATAALVVPPPQMFAYGQFTPIPPRVAAAVLRTAHALFQAQAQFTAPVFGATAPLVTGPAIFSAQALFAKPVFGGAGSPITGSAVFQGTASFFIPERAATAVLVAPAALFHALAVGPIEAPALFGGRYTEAFRGNRYVETHRGLRFTEWSRGKRFEATDSGVRFTEVGRGTEFEEVPRPNRYDEDGRQNIST